MQYVYEVNGLPIYNDLLGELIKIMPKWYEFHTICLNTIPGKDDHQFGSGSLYYDWDKKETVLDENGAEKLNIPARDISLQEHEFTELCSIFNKTPFDIIYRTLSHKYHLGRVRIMTSKPKTCLSWHVDDTKRLHYPIKTQEGCLMVIEDTVTHLAQNKWYMTETLHPHTAMNASKELRIHLVACILGEK